MDQDREGKPGGTNSVETMLLQSQKRDQLEKKQAPPPTSFFSVMRVHPAYEDEIMELQLYSSLWQLYVWGLVTVTPSPSVLFYSN